MKSMDKTDIELVYATLHEDKNAFALIVDRYLDSVYQFAYRYVQDREEAEDVAQEAFVRAWKNLESFDTARNFKTWLFAIAKNAALDFLKKKKPLLFSRIIEDEERLDSFLAPYMGNAELPDEVFEGKLAAAEMGRALDTLPPAYRTVLSMRYHDNLKFREIAEALGEPIDTVKSKHRRGLMLLRKVMMGEAA